MSLVSEHDVSDLNAKILLLDDSPTVRASVRKELEGKGLQVVETDNPITVPYLVWKEQPKILLLDVEMPAMNGDEVAKLVGEETRKQITVLLYSSLNQLELARLARKCGADGSIQKTGRDGDLYHALEKWLK